MVNTLKRIILRKTYKDKDSLPIDSDTKSLASTVLLKTSAEDS